jgi:hypothetical protein
MDNLTIIKTELWFLPFDVLMIITTSLTLILGVIFLCIVITHKICWSVPMILICNSCLAEVLLSCILLSMAIFTFEHDLKKDVEDTSFCVTIAFLCYITDTVQNYSYLLTAIYRYVSVVYPTKILWQSAKFQVCLIIGQWIFCIVFALPLLLTGQIMYNIDNQICQVPLRLSLAVIYISIILYIIPNLSILFVYIKLARYVRQMSIRTISAQTLFHARRELRLVQRTFILTNILIILGIPYAIFTFISFFTTPPKYHFRIAYICIDISILSIMIVTYCFTKQIQEIIQKLLPQSNTIEPVREIART